MGVGLRARGSGRVRACGETASHRRRAPARAPRGWATLASVLLALACSGCDVEEPEPTEWLERLSFEALAAPAPLADGPDTRSGVALAAPFERRACLSAARGAGTVELAARAPDAAVEILLHPTTGSGIRVRLERSWQTLRRPLPAGTRCIAVEADAPAGARVELTTPRAFGAGTRRRPWVVLYVVDTLRGDRSALLETSPAIREFLRDAVVYERAFATSSWTRPTVASLLTGRYPGGHRVFDRQDRLPDAVERLPAMLAARGWQTAAFSSNANVLPAWGFFAGFDRFVDVDSLGWMVSSGYDGLRDRVVTFVREHADRPVFLYVHDNEPHFPYRPTDPYRAIAGAPPRGDPAEEPDDPDDAALLARSRQLYDAEVRSTADRFGALLTALREHGRYEDAVIVLVGDHGEEFGEHGQLSHGRTLYQEQLHVPLLVKGPGAAGGAVDAPVSSVDVVPTLLDALGIEVDRALPGRVLPRPGAQAEARALFARLALDGRRADAVTRWPWKYVRDQPSERERLFDLAKDPAERSDRRGERPETLAALRRDLARHRAHQRSGLSLSCVAGAEQTAFEIGLTLTRPRVADVGTEALGLEPQADRLRVEGGAVRLRLVLRPARETPMAEQLPLAAARAQPDRDRVLIDVPADARLRLALRPLSGPTPPRLEAADGRALRAGDLRAADLRSDVGSADPPAGDAPVCRIAYLPSAREVVAEEDVDPAVRRRLRALGYLE
jgi:arylsulfatase A-like enzyme